MCHSLIDDLGQWLVDIPLLMIACDNRATLPVNIVQALGSTALELHVKVYLWCGVRVVLGQDNFNWQSILCWSFKNEMICCLLAREF